MAGEEEDLFNMWPTTLSSQTARLLSQRVKIRTRLHPHLFDHSSDPHETVCR